MFSIRNIPEQIYFVDIKHVTVTTDSPDLSNYVTELGYSMLKSFTPQMGITIEEENILVYISVDIFVTKCRDLHVINVNNFDANNKLHTFLSKEQYLNNQGVGLLFHVKT